MHLDVACQTSKTDLHDSGHVWKRLYSHRRSWEQPGPTAAAYESSSVPVWVSGLCHWAHLPLVLPAVHMRTPSPSPSLHCSAFSVRCSKPQECTSIGRAPAAASESVTDFATCPSTIQVSTMGPTIQVPAVGCVYPTSCSRQSQEKRRKEGRKNI